MKEQDGGGEGGWMKDGNEGRLKKEVENEGKADEYYRRMDDKKWRKEG